MQKPQRNYDRIKSQLSRAQTNTVNEIQNDPKTISEEAKNKNESESNLVQMEEQI